MRKKEIDMDVFGNLYSAFYGIATDMSNTKCVLTRTEVCKTEITFFVGNQLPATFPDGYYGTRQFIPGIGIFNMA